MYKKVTGIYAIRQGEKVYYGSAVCTSGRINMHKRELRTGTHPNVHLQRAYNKHGVEAFTFEVIELCERKDLRTREQHYIDNVTGTLFNMEKHVCELAPREVHSARMKKAWDRRSDEDKQAMAEKISQTLKRKYKDKPEALETARLALVEARASDAMKQNKHTPAANSKRSCTVAEDWADMSPEAKKERGRSISAGMRKEIPKTCEPCGIDFIATSVRQKYCTPNCCMVAFKARRA